MELTLGFSTCPNDTFIFDAMVHGRIDTEGLTFKLVMEDILHLNQRALAEELDVVKISYNAYGHVRGRYMLLRSGGAMGEGVGPLLITKTPMSRQDLIRNNATIAIPGRNTTANLLLSFFAKELTDRREMLFDDVMPAVIEGRCDAGVIIHENRFTYREHGLELVQDLGEYWESQTGLPIPLGAICAHSRLGPEMVTKVDRVLRRSVEYAFAHPEASRPFVRAHAQEMDENVMQQHINLYVNEYSVDMGEKGEQAVATLLAVGEEMNLYHR